MKGSVTLSSMAHVAVLAWGLVSLSGPKPLIVADVEALPIDIVPIEETTRAVQGEKKADLTEKPAPTPTERPQAVQEARNVGDTDNDTRSQRLDAQAGETERSEAPPPSPEPEPSPEVAPDPIRELVDKSEPAPTTELSALNEPPVPVTEEAVADAPQEEAPAEAFAALPDSAPVPERRPEPPKPRSAETQDRTRSDERPTRRQTASSSESESTEDRIAALLNKERASSSGAKRSTDQASLGTRQSSGAAKLSQSEMDALRGAIERCWSVPAGIADAEEMRVTIRMRLNRNGEIEGRPDVDASGGAPIAQRAFAESAQRAVLRCAPYQLPAEKYETWADVVVNFDPSQLF